MFSKLSNALISEKKILMVLFLYTSLQLQHYSCWTFIVVDLLTFTLAFFSIILYKFYQCTNNFFLCVVKTFSN